MRSSLMSLQLLLAWALVWGTSVVKEEEKECCYPGVPPEKSCCRKGNSTQEDPTHENSTQEDPAHENSTQEDPAHENSTQEDPTHENSTQEDPTHENSTQEDPTHENSTQEDPTHENSTQELGKEKKMKKKKMDFSLEPDSEELEERAEEYRERMQSHSGRIFNSMFLKEEAMSYFNKHSPKAFYRPIEDLDIKVQRATGTMLIFPLFLVDTNCTKEEGREFSVPWYERRSSEVAPCVALPPHEQKKLKCRVSIFIDARTSRSSVVNLDCQPVVFWEGSEDTLDMDHLLDFSPQRFRSF